MQCAISRYAFPAIALFAVVACGDGGPTDGGRASDAGDLGGHAGEPNAGTGGAPPSGGPAPSQPSDSGTKPARDAGAMSATEDAAMHPDNSDAATQDAGAGQDSGVPDAGSEGDGDLTVGPDYVTSPDLMDQGRPKGRSFNFTMASSDSAIFKGDDSTLLDSQRHPFTRRIDVYVPALYRD